MAYVEEMVEQKEDSIGCLSEIEAPEAVTTKESIFIAHLEKATDETIRLCGTSHRQLSATCTPQQNRVVERKKRLDEEVYVTQLLSYVKREKGEILINQVMAGISCNGEEFLPEVSNGRVVDSQATSTSIPTLNLTPLTISRSFREGKISSQRRTSVRPSLDADDFLNLFHGLDPVKVELNRLKNEVRDKDREHGKAQMKIKALKLSGRLREKAVEELTKYLLERRNLEIKKINDEKKASMAAQFAAHATQKDDGMPPIEDIFAPLKAELKLARHEIAMLQDDNKTLDRLSALTKASIMHRLKVAEVEKLTQTVRELEKVVLAAWCDCSDAFATALPPQAQSQAAVELVPKKPLPEKGKLLEAVVKADPLLQILLVAGPLPEWRHPPTPLESFEIPPVRVPSTPPRAWYKRFEKFLYKHTLFFKKSLQGTFLLICVYEEDLIFTGNDEALLSSLKECTMKAFDMNDLDECDISIIHVPLLS
ncbi:Microtubule-associated protein 70-4, partial [Cucurbita argyrosperma subsp. argyrosperma]